MINGPINIIRLTNNEKILYIMGDIHYDFQNQTECKYDDKYDSIDIDKFFLLFMKKNKKKIFDLFIEMDNYNFKNIDYLNYKEIYILSIQKLFKFYLIKDKNDIKVNPKYPNFRFHYSDNRNKLLNHDDIFYFYSNNIENKNILNLNIGLIYEKLKEIILESIESLINNSSINKILNNYTNEQTKEIINFIYNNYVLKNFNYLIELINKLILNYNQLTENIIIKEIDKISNLSQLIYVVITDLFFIRKFLDKNYIKNAILYTGQAHLNNIMYLLVKYFNFKVTHVYNYSNIKKINKFLINMTSQYLNHIVEINNEFLFVNYPIIQCSNLFDFPEDFN